MLVCEVFAPKIYFAFAKVVSTKNAVKRCSKVRFTAFLEILFKVCAQKKDVMTRNCLVT